MIRFVKNYFDLSKEKVEEEKHDVTGAFLTGSRSSPREAASSNT